MWGVGCGVGAGGEIGSGECSANLAMCLSVFKIEHALVTLGE